MVYDGVIRGHFVSLRSITLDDAEFSFELRRDPRFVSIMGQAAATLEDQKRFIEWQMNQPGDYYFVVLNRAGGRIGLIGAYNTDGDSCETGREINVGGPHESMEAELLLCDFCIDVMRMKTKVGVIYKHNKKQIALQKRLGLEPVAEIVRSGIAAYEYRVDFLMLREKYGRARKMIEKLAEKEL
ncbi:MAG: GNAT family N-acetyltransferase [Treponema sp.]|nr:GNAT family N-acetyltransferase [Treponema sp.]